MFKLCIIAIVCLLAISSKAIPQHAEKTYAQFKRETEGLKDDTNKVLLYLSFAKSLSAYPTETVRMVAKEAIQLSIKLNYPKGIELCIYEEGIFAENQKDYPLAINYYREALKIAESNKFNEDSYAINNACLNIYYYLADYANAMNIAQKALSLAEQLNNKENQAYYINQVGYIYQKQEKADESIKYYMQYLTLASEIQNNMMVADANNSIGDGYLLKNDNKRALLYLFRALNIYTKMNIQERLNNTQVISRPERIAYTLYKISNAYKKEGNYKQALRYSLAVLAQYKIKGNSFNKYDIASVYINAGDIYALLKNPVQADMLLHKGLTISKSILHREDIRDAYEGLAKNFSYQARYDSAFYYQILFTRLKDAIINEKVSKEINKLEVERRDKEIALLHQNGKLKEAKIARQAQQRNFIIGFATLIAVISFLLLYIKANLKQQKLVFEKQLAVQSERQRISTDMHDEIGTGLSTMLLYINMLKLKLANSNDGINIDRISVLGTELVDQMKEIVWSLSPVNDELASLLFFIRQYFIMLFEPLPHQVSIDFPQSIPDITLEGDIRRNIFLCVKETLNNIIKHAKATQVELRIGVICNTLIIQVKDDGIGLPAPAALNVIGNGIKNINRRMGTMKGKCNMFNDNGTITRFELNLSPTQTGSF
ncbi:MAG: Tetratricopeptide repeat-containing protein [Mucilaginibacter sp.]|nr:Tetratricopeptide repeat-containing protein [Mucilaginibacter sp.]